MSLAVDEDVVYILYVSLCSFMLRNFILKL